MPGSKAVQLHTKRLLLKDLTTHDAEALLAYRSLPEVTEFQGWKPNTVNDALDFVTNGICHHLDQPDTWFQLGIFLESDLSLIGDAGLHFLPLGWDTASGKGNGQKDDEEKTAAPLPTDTVEIGITIAPAHQGKGYASEAVRCVLRFLFEELNKNKVVASVDPANHKSMSLMRRVGFQLEGIYPKSVFFQGEWADDAAFSLTVEQWKAHVNSKR